MTVAQLIALDEVTRLIRLLGECRELGEGPLLWRQHFCVEIAEFVDAEYVLSAELSKLCRGRLRTRGATEWFRTHSAPIERFAELAAASSDASLQADLWYELLGAYGRTAEGACHCQMLRAFWSTRTATTGGYPPAVLGSLCPLDKADFEGHIVGRAPGRPTFDDRALALVELIHQEVTRLVGGPLARAEEPAPSQLPSRVQEVLSCLLEGATDQQIANRLKISLHTVRQYTKQIYRFFGVHGRTDLLARWVRRGWGSKANWQLARSDSGAKASLHRDKK